MRLLYSELNGSGYDLNSRIHGCRAEEHSLVGKITLVLVVLVLVLIKNALNHQKDAHPKASVYPGFNLMSVFTSSHRKRL